MVGIVIVSHSATLAEGVRELALQMVQQPFPFATAGGIDNPENPIGTDVMKVLEAILAAYSNDGVVVLMDLGSALISAETALDFLEPEQREKVHLIEAPLVEGAVAAALQASLGAGVEAVIAEARGALLSKREQLAPLLNLDAAPSAEQPDFVPDEVAQEIHLIVPNRLGLHARPAARFVSTASRFESAVEVLKGGRSANAKSLNQVAALGARQGDAIVIRAAGRDAAETLAALQALADENFGDHDEPSSTAPASAQVSRLAAEGQLNGLAAAPGFAVGPVARYEAGMPIVERHSTDDPGAELARLEGALDAAAREIEALYTKTRREAGAEEAAIFEAHLMLLRDPELHDEVRRTIHAELVNVEAAWLEAIERAAGALRALEDPYMQERALDVLDVGRRVLLHLSGTTKIFTLERPSIIVASELTPSDTAGLEVEKVLAICTERGGATSHSAILSRSLGIPAIVGIGGVMRAVRDGQIVGVDGESGQFWPNPDEETHARLEAARQTWLDEQARAKLGARQLAITRDGVAIEVAANIGSIQDAGVAAAFGADGVGLLRTEFLFMGREAAPDEDEQLEAYIQIGRALQGRPIIIRTLDIGGDKPLPYLQLEPEENPFLGWRGIRLCLGSPDLFKTQLRAILRAGYETPVKIMFPMVATIEEVRAATALLDECRMGLTKQGIPFAQSIETGIMVEVPAAVAIADQLAREVDFFSIGTNDLTQYTMAADRGNAKVAGLANALHPAVLRLIAGTARAARAAGIWAGMCGELAGSALAAPFLVGVGLTELSMSAPSIPAVKERVRGLSQAEATAIAEHVLTLDTVQAVSAYLAQFGG
jgi:phosphocarrier protein FPr